MFRHTLIDVREHLSLDVIRDVVVGDQGSGYIGNTAKFMESTDDNDTAIYSMMNLFSDNAKIVSTA